MFLIIPNQDQGGLHLIILEDKSGSVLGLVWSSVWSDALLPLPYSGHNEDYI